MKAMLQKSVHLQTSSPPTMVWAVLKLVNLIYICFFFFTLAALLFERWFGEPPVGVYNSFLLTTKYVKRSLPTKSLTRIFDFQLAPLALENWHSVIHYVIQIYWKIPLNELNASLLVEDLFLLQPYEKVYSFRDFVKDFSLKFENTSGYLLWKSFLYDKKTCFFYLFAEYIYC